MNGRSEGPLRCLAALYDSVILIDWEGGVFSAGNNSIDQLGRSSGNYSKLQRISNIPPMLAASCRWIHTLCLDEDGGVWSWGMGGEGQLGTGNIFIQSEPTLVPSLKGMVALVAGRFHSLAFSREGGLLVFGTNYFGQLSLSHTIDQSTPTLSPVQPDLPHLATSMRKKSARSDMKGHFP